MFFRKPRQQQQQRVVDVDNDDDNEIIVITEKNNSNNMCKRKSKLLLHTLFSIGVTIKSLIKTTINTLTNKKNKRLQRICIILLVLYSIVITILLVYCIIIVLVQTTHNTNSNTIDNANEIQTIQYLPSTNNNNNNNNRIAIVHIGPHKTGTTTIQYECYRLRHILLVDQYELPSTSLMTTPTTSTSTTTTASGTGSTGTTASTNHYKLAHCLKHTIHLSNNYRAITLMNDNNNNNNNNNKYTATNRRQQKNNNKSVSLSSLSSSSSSILLSSTSASSASASASTSTSTSRKKNNNSIVGTTRNVSQQQQQQQQQQRYHRRLTRTTTTTTSTSSTATANNNIMSMSMNDTNCDSDYLISIARIATFHPNSSIILSAERFATPDVLPELINTILLPWSTSSVSTSSTSPSKSSNIRIIAYYRHYYDWFISWHNQIMKQHRRVQQQQLKLKRNVKPESTKNVIVPIVDWVNDKKRVKSLYNTIYTVGCVTRYRNYFGTNSVYVYNVHNHTYNLIRDFFCLILPNANNTCQTIIKEQQQQEQKLKLNNNSNTNFNEKTNQQSSKSSSSSSTKKNSAEVLVYEDIAYAMMVKYETTTMLDNTATSSNNNDKNTKKNEKKKKKLYTISTLTQLIQEYHYEQVQEQLAERKKEKDNNTDNRITATSIIKDDFNNEIEVDDDTIILANSFDIEYIICPKKESLQLLYNLTIAAYTMFVPEVAANDNGIVISNLKNDFIIASQTVNKLCSLNTTKLLIDHIQWKLFYEKLFFFLKKNNTSRI